MHERLQQRGIVVLAPDVCVVTAIARPEWPWGSRAENCRLHRAGFMP